MMNPDERTWQRSSFCGDTTCVDVAAVEEQAGAYVVPVRNTRARTEYVPLLEWRRLVRETIEGQLLELTEWFPPTEYGDFASTFSAAEEDAFIAGVKAGQFNR